MFGLDTQNVPMIVSVMSAVTGETRCISLSNAPVESWSENPTPSGSKSLLRISASNITSTITSNMIVSTGLPKKGSSSLTTILPW